MKRIESLGLSSLLPLLAVVGFVLSGCSPPPPRANRPTPPATATADANLTPEAVVPAGGPTGSTAPGAQPTPPAEPTPAVEPTPEPTEPAPTVEPTPTPVEPEPAPPAPEKKPDELALNAPVAEGPKVPETPAAIDPLDWPNWRGPEFNSISRETGLIDNFDASGGEGSNVLWKREDLGSISTPIVLRGKLYTLCRSDPGKMTEGEKVVCVNPATGETIWENKFNVWLSDVPDTRVGWSSVVGDPATGNIYALGVCGYFQCINGETGKTIWSLPLHEQYGLLSTYGGRTNIPIVYEDMVIISGVLINWGELAKPAHRIMAFNKLTGELVWLNGTRLLPEDTTYSTPMVGVVKGQAQMILGSGDGAVWSFQPRTGKANWDYKLSPRGMNASPVLVGDQVFGIHGEENLDRVSMGSVFCIDATGSGDVTETKTVWSVPDIVSTKCSVVVVDDRVYAVDDGAKMFVLDAKTGEQIGKRLALGTMMKGTPLYADGKLYVFTATGRWYIMRPDADAGVKIISKGFFNSGDEVQGSPICSHGRIFVPTTGGLYALEDTKQQHGSTPRPSPPAEAANEDQTPATVQIIPAEVLLKPGDKQQFTVRTFNAAGQLISEKSEAVFALDGPGEIAAGGLFAAPSDALHQATIVKAKVGELEGMARVRVVPPLPWSFDFEQTAIDAAKKAGEPPITWIGARYRHVVRDVDGNKVMVKVSTIPKGTRSRSFIGPSDLHDYTIQCDVRAGAPAVKPVEATTETLPEAAPNAAPGDSGRKLPDMGVIAQGYTFDMQGANQKLHIRTWDSQLHNAKGIDFPWEADKWYTIKFQAVNEADKVILRGKVWPKGEAEPAEWTITHEVEGPQKFGSPGLFGNATTAEVYFDNVVVTPNP